MIKNVVVMTMIKKSMIRKFAEAMMIIKSTIKNVVSDDYDDQELDQECCTFARNEKGTTYMRLQTAP
jgi:Na+-translocating ferredoxin:NAD+ oxidoreductase RnfG subunit